MRRNFARFAELPALTVEDEVLGHVASSPPYGMVRPLILDCRLALGDIVMLTGIVRDLHLHHPCRFLTDVRTGFPDIWRFNPLVTPLSSRFSGIERIRCDKLADPTGVNTPIHCAQAVATGLARHLNIPVFDTFAGGDIPLSPGERRFPRCIETRIGRNIPYWILVAGGKQDCPVKWWNSERYQTVVDHFRGRILFVQVGAAIHSHPAIRGVLDLRGRTSLRELIQLVHHAQGVLCPITSLMHLSAAIETPEGAAASRPCVVVAGGREAPHWAAYPNHQFIHSVGSLACCATNGCWRSRLLPDFRFKDPARDACLDLADGLPRCMDLITPEAVAARIQIHFDGGNLAFLSPREATAVERATGRHVASPSLNVPVRFRSSRRPHPPDQSVTFCVLTCGDHRRLVRRCLDSIHRHCPRRKYQLVVGANGASEETLEYLQSLRSRGRIDRLHISPVNISKCPMMRRLLASVRTEFVWWLDDDVEFTDRGAFDLRLITARSADSETVLWGDLHTCDLGTWKPSGVDVEAWIRRATWFRGRPIGQDQWKFPAGAQWLARMTSLRALDWPDRRLLITSEDVIFGEAIRQQGWRMEDLGSLGIRLWPEPSRGPDRNTIMHQQFRPAALEIR